MPGIGHLMNLEAPDEFDTLLLEFLREPQPESSVHLH
jgi:pimeloyl-ACP methyl ester carboxylesterase